MWGIDKCKEKISSTDLEGKEFYAFCVCLSVTSGFHFLARFILLGLNVSLYGFQEGML